MLHPRTRHGSRRETRPFLFFHSFFLFFFPSRPFLPPFFPFCLAHPVLCSSDWGRKRTRWFPSSLSSLSCVRQEKEEEKGCGKSERRSPVWSDRTQRFGHLSLYLLSIYLYLSLSPQPPFVSKQFLFRGAAFFFFFFPFL
jgi:hypothetical protein